jgi:hypothetical protein
VLNAYTDPATQRRPLEQVQRDGIGVGHSHELAAFVVEPGQSPMSAPGCLPPMLLVARPTAPTPSRGLMSTHKGSLYIAEEPSAAGVRVWAGEVLVGGVEQLLDREVPIVVGVHLLERNLGGIAVS